MHRAPESKLETMVSGFVQVPSRLEVAYQQLRRSIMSGQLAPGEHLRQEGISRQLGISRGPAREALNRLVAEGLVQLRPRRGYIVQSLDPAEAEDIFELRIMLEERAGYLATKKRKQSDVVAVENILQEMESIDFNEPTAIPRWAELNRAFHARLFESSGRRHLCRTMMLLRDSVERYVRFEISTLARRSRIKLSSDHRRIFEAFKSGNATLTGRLCRIHCQNISKNIIARLLVAPKANPVSLPKKE